MKIQSNNCNFCNNYQITKGKTPTFGAIHPCLYFEKVDADTFKLITDNNLIKNTLQKNIVTWLNRNYNTRQKLIQGSEIKAKLETPATQKIRERVTKFFTNRDSDFCIKNQDRASSYFYTDKTSGLLHSYIFTGKSVDILDKQANKIKQVHSEIKRLADELYLNNGFSRSAAKDRASKELEQDLLLAKTSYHNTALNTLASAEVKVDPKNTLFCAYFEPHTKGKKTSYKLINAEFKQRLL